KLQRERLYGRRAVVPYPRFAFLKGDRRIARQGEETFFLRTIGPERRVDAIWHHSGGDLVIFHGGEQAGLAELARKGRRGAAARGLLKLCDLPCVVVESVNRTITADSKAGYFYRARRELFVPGDFLFSMIIAKAPDLAVLIITI